MTKTGYICTNCRWATYNREDLIGDCCPICGGETVWYICTEHTWCPPELSTLLEGEEQ